MARSILKEAKNPEKKNDVPDDLTKQKKNSDGLIQFTLYNITHISLFKDKNQMVLVVLL